jgi:hypothetical protein
LAGEGRDQDLKLMFNPTDHRSRVEIVKDIVAMANSGGGKIIFGRSETEAPGLDPDDCELLDSARITDYASKFISPSSVEVSHEIEELNNGNLVVAIHVKPSDYPIVMAKLGTWSGFDTRKDKAAFRPGEIWVRHGSKSERVSHEDVKRWIDRARQEERDKIMQRLTTYVNLPEGTSLQVVSPSGLSIDSPMRLIESAKQRRERDPNHLLSPDDLLWIFRQRNNLDLESGDLSILIASSLRRSSTLFWWLAESGDDYPIIIRELDAIFSASDRDKSDAARSIVEVAAIFAPDEIVESLIDRLADSRYAHFRDAATNWNGRRPQLNELRNRILRAKLDGKLLLDHSVAILEEIATNLAEILADSRSSPVSSKLGDITRVIWAKKTPIGQDLMDIGE